MAIRNGLIDPCQPYPCQHLLKQDITGAYVYSLIKKILPNTLSFELISLLISYPYLFTFFIFFITYLYLFTSFIFVYYNYEYVELFRKNRIPLIDTFSTFLGCCELRRYTSTHTYFLSPQCNLVMTVLLLLGWKILMLHVHRFLHLLCW